MLSQVTVAVLKYVRQRLIMAIAVAAVAAGVVNMAGQRELDFGLSLII